MDLQYADWVIGIEKGWEGSVGNQVVDSTLADDIGRVGSGLLQARVASEICMENMDIRAVA